MLAKSSIIRCATGSLILATSARASAARWRQEPESLSSMDAPSGMPLTDAAGGIKSPRHSVARDHTLPCAARSAGSGKLFRIREPGGWGSRPARVLRPNEGESRVFTYQTPPSFGRSRLNRGRAGGALLRVIAMTPCCIWSRCRVSGLCRDFVTGHAGARAPALSADARCRVQTRQRKREGVAQ